LDAASLTDFYVSYYQDMYARVSDPDVYFARQQSYGNRILDFVRARLRSNCLVVEVGCGAGGALSVFQAAGYQTGGCDYSAHLIELGKKRGLTNLFHGDIDALITGIGADRKADLVILHHVFEHLSDPAQFLEKAKSFLAPEGIILVAVPDVSRADQFPDPDGDLRQFFHIAHKFNFSLTGMQALAARVTMKAHTAQVRESTQAPEFWVAFARPSASGDEARSGQTPTNLYARLRRIELGYVRRAALRKLSRPFLRCANSLAGMVTGTRR
jgi:2-polyprenyl-3-methyl-5-hydroxy-6-metoxy-1,4-benzoquinol methylase